MVYTVINFVLIMFHIQNRYLYFFIKRACGATENLNEIDIIHIIYLYNTSVDKI